MRITIDLDSNRVVLAPGVSAEPDELAFKRAPQAVLEVQFSRGTTIIELPSDAAGIWGLKERPKYDSAPLAGALAWVKTGTGEATFYTFPFTLITGALDALFEVDADVTNDIASLTLMGEVSWRYASRDYKTQTLSVVIDNDVIRDDDDMPSLVLGARVPAGGTTGQHLAKTSNTNFDTEWVDPETGGSLQQEDIAATAGQTIFTLTQLPSDVVLVSVNGLSQPQSEFSRSGMDITLSTPLEVGDVFSAFYLL